jgi:uncharacterized protein YaiL (DUF2058 family)
MLDIHKMHMSDTVTRNPYLDKCKSQALVVRFYQDKVQELLQKRKCTHDVAIRIRVEKQKYEQLEKKFFTMHKAQVAQAHIMEKKQWRDT